MDANFGIFNFLKKKLYLSIQYKHTYVHIFTIYIKVLCLFRLKKVIRFNKIRHQHFLLPITPPLSLPLSLYINKIPLLIFYLLILA